MIPSDHWPAFESVFGWYTRGLLRRRFAALHVRGAVPPTPPSLILACQHVAWWDPLLLFHLSQSYFPPARHDAMMDEANLRRYRFFRWIGAFGVDLSTRSESAKALRHALDLLVQPNLRLLIFPQGRQESMDRRPLRRAPGTAWLAARANAAFCPIALRYEFIEDERPEIFVSIGAATKVERASARGDADPIVDAISAEADMLRDDVHHRRFETFSQLFDARERRKPA